MWKMSPYVWHVVAVVVADGAAGIALPFMRVESVELALSTVHTNALMFLPFVLAYVSGVDCLLSPQVKWIERKKKIQKKHACKPSQTKVVEICDLGIMRRFKMHV